MLPPEEIVAQVQLNPDGLALYRLDRNAEISVPEARRLVEIGWGEPDVVHVFTPDGVSIKFECIALTLDGGLALADLELAVAPLTKKWGERREISVFARAALAITTKTAERRGIQARVFSRRIFSITFQEGVDDQYSESARGWYPGNIDDWPVEELKLRSFYDREKPTQDAIVSVQNNETDKTE